MTAEARIDMERKILGAAEELFLEKGFAMTSTVAIAKRAGCNQALVHYYFRTKDRLVEAVLKEKITLFLSVFTKIDEEADSFEERIRRKVEAHFDIIAENPRLPFLLINEFAGNPDRLPFIRGLVETLPKKLFGDFAKQLKAEIKAGRIRQMESADLLLTVISLNASLFLAEPLITGVFGLDKKNFNALIRRRRQEHVDIVMRSLKP